MPWPVLVFDIESIPDVAGLRLLRNSGADASDEQVYAGWSDYRVKTDPIGRHIPVFRLKPR